MFASTPLSLRGATSSPPNARSGDALSARGIGVRVAGDARQVRKVLWGEGSLLVARVVAQRGDELRELRRPRAADVGCRQEVQHRARAFGLLRHEQRGTGAFDVPA